ncbi:MAG: NnrS family protein [Acidobacteriota bacterium]|nr:NnrS family protein [Acidobacteriota bacterium]
MTVSASTIDRRSGTEMDGRGGRPLLAAFIATGLFFLAMPGTVIGVGNLLLIAAAQAAAAPAPAWIQAHGQAQIFGWVGSFIIGISLFVLPRFRGIPPASAVLGWLTWALWTAGVTLHWLAGVNDIAPQPALVVAALLRLAGFLVSQYLLVIAPLRAARAGTVRHRPARDLGSMLGIAGFCGLGATLVVDLVAAVSTAPGSAAYPPALDRILLELSLWTFVLPIALGYSARFTSMFLGLRPAHPPQATPLGVRSLDLGRLLTLIVVAIAISALLQAFIVTAILAFAFTLLTIWALRVFEPPERPAFTAGVDARSPAFVRLAFGWLAIGAALGVAAAMQPAAGGLPGAGRHAITVGFVATLIFALAPRLLPGFLHRRLFSRGLMAASLWLLTIGCALRVVSEAAAYGMPGSWGWQVLPLSGVTELTAVLLFVLNLGATFACRPRGVAESPLLEVLPAAGRRPMEGERP